MGGICLYTSSRTDSLKPSHSTLFRYPEELLCRINKDTYSHGAYLEVGQLA